MNNEKRVKPLRRRMRDIDWVWFVEVVGEDRRPTSTGCSKDRGR